MSWSELERLVEEAEADAALRRALSHCRSLPELLLACRRLGYRIDGSDLRLARSLDRGETRRSTGRRGPVNSRTALPRRRDARSPGRHPGERRG